MADPLDSPPATIPDNASDITSEWLLDILRLRDPSATAVKDVQVSAGSVEGSGYLGCLVRVRCRSDSRNDSRNADSSSMADNVKSGHHDLIVKLLPTMPNLRNMVLEERCDERETQMYTHVLPQLIELEAKHNCADIREMVADCLFGKVTDYGSKHQFALVLENLNSSGYASADFHVGMTTEQCQAAVKALAQFHATGYVLKVTRKKTLRELFPFLYFSNPESGWIEFFHNGYRQLCELLKDHPSAIAIKAKLDPVAKDASNIISAMWNSHEPFQLLCHGDFWNNNILLKEEKPDGTCASKSSRYRVKVIDWQLTTQGNPTNDLGVLILASLSASTRRSCMDNLLTTYWETFSEKCSRFGVEPLCDQASFLKEARENGLRLALFWCIACTNLFYKDSELSTRLTSVVVDMYEQNIL